MKRLFDISASLVILCMVLPLLVIAALAVFLQDFRNPIYVASRVGKGGRPFSMYKIRSMAVSRLGEKVQSTANDDRRITKVGRVIRKLKIDELSQLVNVLRGDMSLVGPRPNVSSETSLYSFEEKALLSMRPGITDFSSIVFSDEGDILNGSHDPDLLYNQVIRPYKSRLGLFYVENCSLVVDFKLMVLTCLSLFSRSAALEGVAELLSQLGCSELLKEVSLRQKPLSPMPPPGFESVIQAR